MKVVSFFMLVFQCEENANLQDCARYLKLPFSKSNLPGNNQTVKGTKESLWITSFLCSTKLTQNGNVLVCVCVSSYAILYYSLFGSVFGIIQQQLQPTMRIFGLLA